MTKLLTDNKIPSQKSSLLDEIIERTEPQPLSGEPSMLPSIQLAKIVSNSNEGISITFNDNEQPILALSLAPITESDVGKICAIQFINGNQNNPLIVGMIYSNNYLDKLSKQIINNATLSCVEQDQLHIQASKSITLQCGESSLTMTADGFVQIRALYIDNYALATNRIKGASVQVN